MKTAANDVRQDRLDGVHNYLRELYDGVFTPEAIERHIEDHVGFTFADWVAPLVQRGSPSGAKLLDIGSGFGSFVLRARELGLDAFGIELAAFEVEYARKRLELLRPIDNAVNVYRLGDIRDLSWPDECLDVVTLWNVMEHIPKPFALLQIVQRLLKPGGSLYIICPNYAAFRLEAHYHVPWYPFLPRHWASWYLRRKGNNPRFFETNIHYTTNWGVLWALKRLGLQLWDLSNSMRMDLALTNFGVVLRNPVAFARFYNPLSEAVLVAARKPLSNHR